MPNGIGTILGMVQLLLYFYYKRSSDQDSTEPLIASYGWSVALCCWVMMRVKASTLFVVKIYCSSQAVRGSYQKLVQSILCELSEWMNGFVIWSISIQFMGIFEFALSSYVVLFLALPFVNFAIFLCENGRFCWIKSLRWAYDVKFYLHILKPNSASQKS